MGRFFLGKLFEKKFPKPFKNFPKRVFEVSYNGFVYFSIVCPRFGFFNMSTVLQALPNSS